MHYCLGEHTSFTWQCSSAHWYFSRRTRRALSAAVVPALWIYLFWNLSFVATAARCPFKDFPFLIYTYIRSNLNWDILASFHFLTLHYQAGVTPNLLGLGYIPNQVMEEQGQGIKATHHPSPKETLHRKQSEGQPISRPHLFAHVRILNSPPFELLTLFLSVWVLFIPNTRARLMHCLAWKLASWKQMSPFSFFLIFYLSRIRMDCAEVHHSCWHIGEYSTHLFLVIVLLLTHLSLCPCGEELQITKLLWVWSDGHSGQRDCGMI